MKKQLLITALAAITLQASAQQETAHSKNIKTDTVARSLPSPIDSPPFPTSEWDGAPLVGINSEAPNYPLIKHWAYPAAG